MGASFKSGADVEKPPERVELSEIDRNIEALVKGLVEDVHEVFVNSGVGIGQRVVVHKPCEASLPKGNEGEGTRLRMRERTVFEVCRMPAGVSAQD